MGDYGFSEVSAGFGTVRANFTERGLPFDHRQEFVSAFKHSVLLDADKFSKGSQIYVQLTGTSHVGFLDYTFDQPDDASEDPNIVVQATRAGWRGAVFVNPEKREISGWNPQRFVSTFDNPSYSHGTRSSFPIAPFKG